MRSDSVQPNLSSAFAFVCLLDVSLLCELLGSVGVRCIWDLPRLENPVFRVEDGPVHRNHDIPKSPRSRSWVDCCGVGASRSLGS